jgi:hypothetical protein
MYQGGKAEKEARSALGGISAERNKAVADALRGFSTNMAGAPASEAPKEMFVADDGGGGEMTMGTQVTPAVSPNPMAAYQALMASPDASMRSAAMTGMARIPEMEAAQQERVDARAFRQQEAEAARAQRLQELQMRAEDQRNSQAERLQAQREMRQMQIDAQRQTQLMIQANRPEKNVTVMGANGEPITMPQSHAQGMPLYNPQAAAQLQKSKTKSEAKEQLSGVVQQLNNSYTALEKGGGITSTGQGTLANIGAAAGSSRIGQAIGGALGTENQRQRQEIEQTRPLLLNLIKEATGMSAQQMNSNAEMQLYLQAATDPKLSVEANRSALANLDKMFGLGLAKRPEEGGANPPVENKGTRPGQPAAAPTFDQAKEQRYQNWLKSQGR